MQVPVNILIILWLKVNRIAAKIRLPPETDGLWYSCGLICVMLVYFVLFVPHKSKKIVVIAYELW